ncbi:hypothetical protein VDG1235_826 [Verrucomicrobiia bacterium DG1235]|nr:hypothetical protein VDG1235_826 [Verrucomicrobiae bacterium DG1235]
MNNIKRTLLTLITASAAFSATSLNATSVGYINASGGDISGLSAFGHTVTSLSNPIDLTLAQLSAFDAVIVTSNSTFSQAAHIGNILADFADLGGGVVLTEFVFQGGWALGGRIMTEGYSPFTVDPLSGGYLGFNSSIGTVFESGSPLLTDVTSLNNNYEANSNVSTGATLVADWTSGRHAIAYNSLTSSSVVGINGFPGSMGTHGNQLLSNAIEFSLSAHSAQRSSAGVPDSGSTLALTALGLLALIGFRARRS